MRRPFVLLLTFVLALATGATLLGLAAIVTAGPRDDAGTDDSIALVRAFYAAVNDALRSGDSTALEAVLAPELVDHRGIGGAASGRDDLKRHVAALRTTFPDLRLTVDDLIAESTRVTARVTARGTRRPSFVGISLRAETVTWEEIDVFRVADGTIAERWGGYGAVSLFQPLGEASLAEAPTWPVAVALARLTYPAGTEPAWYPFPGPGLVAVETGTLVLRGNGTAQIVRAGEEDRHEVATLGAEIALYAGDAVAVPGYNLVLRNGGAGPAVALGLVLLPAVSGRYEQTLMIHNGVPSLTGAVALAMLGLADGAAVGLEGLRVEALAVGELAPLAPGSATIAVGRATLAPGSGLPPHEVEGAELLIIEAGNLGLDAVGPLQVAELGNEVAERSNLSLPRYLAAGETALVGPEWTGGARNTGDGPLVVVVATIRPVAPETAMADTALTTSR